jgi:hypothetical protein
MRGIAAVTLLCAAGSACNYERCDPGVLPFDGQTQVPRDLPIRVDLRTNADLAGVPYREVIRLTGPDGPLELELLGDDDGLVTMRPVVPLGEEAHYQLDVDVLGGRGSDLSRVAQSSPNFSEVPAIARFQTGGEVRALGAEGGFPGYRVLLSAPPPEGWERDHLRVCVVGAAPDDDCLATALVVSGLDPHLVTVTVPDPPALGSYALWSRAGERWEELGAYVRPGWSDEGDLGRVVSGTAYCHFEGGR